MLKFYTLLNEFSDFMFKYSAAKHVQVLLTRLLIDICHTFLPASFYADPRQKTFSNLNLTNSYMSIPPSLFQ